MSSLEWFYRMENALKIKVPEVNGLMNDYVIEMTTDTTEYHPCFSFFVEMDDRLFEFCLIQFDPVYQEFYSYYYNEEFALDSKVLLPN